MSNDDHPNAASAPETLGAAARRVPVLDWLLLILALVSIALLSYETWGDVTPEWRRWLIRGDYAICAIFAVEFTWRWSRDGWTRGYLLRNWYEILGMIPVSEPALRGFRLFRVVRIVILLSRFGMAADRALGDEFTYRLVNRFRDRIMRAVGGMITLAVLAEVSDVLKRGTYTRNVARALEENDRELRAMITEKLSHNARTKTLSRLPFYNDIVNSVVDAALELAHDVLNDPRTDELVADILRENVDQLRAAVQAKEDAKHQAVSPVAQE
ncbi:ion transporter [Nevskia ramosa]|uniref:ion transporter n=1 Tax=Nevskia ramosa TaxID=64002 RepID=UPI0023578572|nr:ion transporter [Nevskia ramosa]